MAIYYVTQTGAGTKDGSEWAKAFSDTEFGTHVTNTCAAGDIYYVAGGTYTALNSSRDGSSGSPISIIGVVSGTTAEPPTSADWAYGSDRPLFSTTSDSTGAITLDNYWQLWNLRALSTGASGVGIRVDIGGRCINVKAEHTGAFSQGGFISTPSNFFLYVGCEGISTTGDAFVLYTDGRMVGCYAHDSDRGAWVVSGDNDIINCVFDTCATAGIKTNSTVHNSFIGNVIYACGTGILSAGSGRTLIMHNIIDSCTLGIEGTFDTTLYSIWSDYNCWNNTTDFSNFSAGTHDLVATDPLFTNPTGNPPDFTLQSISPCLNAGFPDTNWATRVGLTAGRY